MNNLNYASFEASKRLVDAGIVLETEKYFEIPYEEDSKTFCQVNNNGTDAAVLPAKIRRSIKIPRPCFTEVWRELPFQSYIKKLDDGSTLVWICDDDTDGKYIESNMIANTNPTDALIDLLVWLKGAGK